MSTFDGLVKEFPDIRIDRFTQTSRPQRPALAYFLSHIHSDHLQGLESCKSPFIYCSPATREMLLRLEKYPHRMNFARGILEQRKQTYVHLKKLLKPIPLETPTDIELAPGRSIRVTLFDANHCIGACMFLIEGNGKAVLYTGDIRSERWWVNSLCRHPLLIPYVSSGSRKSQKRLDCVYLDTSFAHKEDQYRHFPAKADGIAELLVKVSLYPRDTEFYFDTWTFGYEDVWQALSNFLGSQIHVDEYRYGMYMALHNGREPKAKEAYQLIGVHCGNHFQDGCLSNLYRRIHSCERGTGCDIFNQDFVRITPIISRHNGVEMAEVGIGGGHGDLNQQHELEVDDHVLKELMALCAQKLEGQPNLPDVVQMVTKALSTQRISFDLADFAAESATCRSSQLDREDQLDDLDELPIERIVPLLAKRAAKLNASNGRGRGVSGGLPRHITFPYSRHSSYEELYMLLEVFKPRDIHPCTVDERNWTPRNSMSYLFGDLYEGSVPTFNHDALMLGRNSRQEAEEAGLPTNDTQRSDVNEEGSFDHTDHSQPVDQHDLSGPGPKRRRLTKDDAPTPKRIARTEAERPVPDFVELTPFEIKEGLQHEAYDAVLHGSSPWSLVSVDGHQIKEEEL